MNWKIFLATLHYTRLFQELDMRDWFGIFKFFLWKFFLFSICKDNLEDYCRFFGVV